MHRPTALVDYLALTKPRLNLLVVVTSAAGYYLGAAGGADVLPMAPAVAGTALVAAARRSSIRCTNATPTR